MKCARGYELEVMKSPAGYYIGTRDEDGIPNCRYSKYAKQKETIVEILKDTWLTWKAERDLCEENKWCCRQAGAKWCYEIEKEN